MPNLCLVARCRQDPEVRAVTSGGTWGGAVASGGARPVDTLAIYIYSKSDPEYEQNLRFFIRHAVTAGDGCEYVIVVQQVRRRRLMHGNVKVVYDCVPGQLQARMCPHQTAAKHMRKPCHAAAAGGHAMRIALNIIHHATCSQSAHSLVFPCV